MRTILLLIAVLSAFSNVVLAEDDPFAIFEAWPNVSGAETKEVPNYVIAPKSFPTFRILPKYVAQASIKQFRFTTTNRSSFAVRWTYTEEGAKKFLAFREAYEGKKIRTVIGGFETQPMEMIFRPIPPYFTNYTQWREGWLKSRSDKFVGVSEEDAKAIMAGLK